MSRVITNAASRASTNKRTSIVLALCCALIGVIAPTPTVSLSAQSVERIDAAKPSCPGCTLTLTKIATLGSVDDPTLPGVGMHATGLAIDSKGQFLVTALGSDQVVLYSPSGKFLRAIGRKGRGPGEFSQAIRSAMDANDSLFVMDVGRISVFSPSLEYARTVTLPLDPSLSMLLLPDKSVVLPYMGGYRGGPVRRVSNTGAPSLFTRDTAAFGFCKNCTLVIGKSGAADRFWSTYNARYELRMWNSAAENVRTVSVTGSTWHRDGEINWAKSAEVAPPPTVIALAEDNQRQLWVHGEMPTADWKPYERRAPSAARGSTGVPVGSAFPGPETLKRLISVVDVFDLANHRLLLSQRFPNRKFLFVAPGILAEVREDKDDIPVWDIYRVTIKR